MSDSTVAWGWGAELPSDELSLAFNFCNSSMNRLVHKQGTQEVRKNGDNTATLRLLCIMERLFRLCTSQIAEWVNMKVIAYIQPFLPTNNDSSGDNLISSLYYCLFTWPISYIQSFLPTNDDSSSVSFCPSIINVYSFDPSSPV
jgi:hypothetical protein